MKKLLFTMSALLMSVTGFAQANATAVALKIDIEEMALVTRGITEVTFDLQAPQVAGGKVTVVAVTPSDYVQSTMIEQGDGSGISVQGGSVAVSVSGLRCCVHIKVSNVSSSERCRCNRGLRVAYPNRNWNIAGNRFFKCWESLHWNRRNRRISIRLQS